MENSAKNTDIHMSGPVVKKPQLAPKWENNSVQYGKVRGDCFPRIGDRYLQLECKFVFYIVTAGHVRQCPFRSSNTTK